MNQELLSESKETLKQNKKNKRVRNIILHVISGASIYSAVELNWLPAKILLGITTTGVLIPIFLAYYTFKHFQMYCLKTESINFKTLITKYGFFLSINNIPSVYLLMSGWYFTGTVFLLASLCMLFFGVNKKAYEEWMRIERS